MRDASLSLSGEKDVGACSAGHSFSLPARLCWHCGHIGYRSLLYVSSAGGNGSAKLMASFSLWVDTHGLHSEGHKSRERRVRLAPEISYSEACVADHSPVTEPTLPSLLLTRRRQVGR